MGSWCVGGGRTRWELCGEVGAGCVRKVVRGWMRGDTGSGAVVVTVRQCPPPSGRWLGSGARCLLCCCVGESGGCIRRGRYDVRRSPIRVQAGTPAHAVVALQPRQLVAAGSFGTWEAVVLARATHHQNCVRCGVPLCPAPPCCAAPCYAVQMVIASRDYTEQELLQHQAKRSKLNPDGAEDAG